MCRDVPGMKFYKVLSTGKFETLTSGILFNNLSSFYTFMIAVNY